ncbi:ABC transporter substrate-binding protein [Larsenimonas salina]|uniref:ABC transporter substrate-binding protein n=1 Tax=Larsenimonas salina TaxID=1295565 RepID=UPI002073DD61|nr:spermidine/putrescine ABC transporter substrate-binding protein [Larsenimonas salina]MCM5703087.1 spermidine/putrescine ABC transporter substrate-binding protein [Larsenimonas salina]
MASVRFKGVLMCAALTMSLPSMAASKTLTLFNWTDYLPPTVLDEFEQRFDVRVVQNYYNSNAEMFAKLQAGGDRQYDVVFPSGYFVDRLKQADLVQPLDASKLQNRTHLLEEFKDPSYDPSGRYSMPYQWGVTGIAYDASALPELPHSWGALFDADANPDRPFGLLKGDGQFTLSSACAYLGNGFDCPTRQAWIDAAKVVQPTMKRPNYVGFVDALAALDQLSRGVIDVGVVYNGDYARKKAESPEAFKNIAFFVPSEGSQRWVDTMVIPKHAPNPELAHQFINFLSEPGVAAQISNWTFYSSPNKDALDALKPILRSAPVMPDAAVRERLKYTASLDADTLQFVQQLWTELRAR